MPAGDDPQKGIPAAVDTEECPPLPPRTPSARPATTSPALPSEVIVPGLEETRIHIGPGWWVEARDVRRLVAEHHITHVVNCTPEKFGISAPDPATNLVFTRVPMEDSSPPPGPVRLLWEEAASAISAGLDSAPNARVFVHCTEGVSRSASVVLYFLMKHFGLSLRSAMEALITSRPCVSPNAGLWKQLVQAEEDLVPGAKGESTYSLAQYEAWINDRIASKATRG